MKRKLRTGPTTRPPRPSPWERLWAAGEVVVWRRPRSGPSCGSLLRFGPA